MYTFIYIGHSYEYGAVRFRPHLSRGQPFGRHPRESSFVSFYLFFISQVFLLCDVIRVTEAVFWSRRETP